MKKTGPFRRADDAACVQAAEDIWNNGDAVRILSLFSEDCQWRIGTETPTGHREIFDHIVLRSAGQLGRRILLEMWAVQDDRFTLGFASEWHDETGDWFRAWGIECWQFGRTGLIQKRLVATTREPIEEAGRKLRWPRGSRPCDHAGLTALGF